MGLQAVQVLTGLTKRGAGALGSASRLKGGAGGS